MKQLINSHRYIDFLKCALLFLLALIVKGLYIGETGIGGDECFSAYSAQLPVDKIISLLSKGDNPPLWEIILHYWIQLFGVGEISLRIPSLIFNSLTVIPIFLIGEKFIAKNVGVIASFLFVFSSFALFLSHEARVYSLVTFLSSLSMYVFLSILKEPKNLWLYIVLTIINTLIIYSHYIAFWIIIVQGISFLSKKKTRNLLGYKYILHLIGIALLFSPFIPVLLHRFLESGIKGTWVPKVNGIESLYGMIWDFSNKPVVTVIFITIIVFAFIRTIINRKVDNDDQQFALKIHLWVWLPLLISFLLSFKTSFFLDRYFFFISPGFYLSLMISLNYLVKTHKYTKIVSFCTMMLLMLFTFNISSSTMKFSGHHKNTKLIAEKISSYVKKDSALIIVCPKWFDKDIVYYLDRNLFKTYFKEYDKDVVFKEPLNSMGIYSVNHFSELNLSKKYKSIIYLDNNCSFNCPENGISAYLNKSYKFQEKCSVDDRNFYIFHAEL